MVNRKFDDLGLSDNGGSAAHPEASALFWMTHEDAVQNLLEAQDLGFTLEALTADKITKGFSVRDMAHHAQLHFLLMWHRRYPKLVWELCRRTH